MHSTPMLLKEYPRTLYSLHALRQWWIDSIRFGSVQFSSVWRDCQRKREREREEALPVSFFLQASIVALAV